MTVPADLTLEATGPDGAVADFDADVTADDVVDGPLAADLRSRVRVPPSRSAPPP